MRIIKPFLLIALALFLLVPSLFSSHRFTSVTVPVRAQNETPSWTQIGFSDQRIDWVVVHPADSQTLYVSVASGVYKTTNGGTSWGQVLSASTTWRRSELAINPQNPQIMYVASSGTGNNPQGQIARSVDSGNTWVGVLSGRAFLSVAVDPIDPNVVYAVEYAIGGWWWTSEVWKSFDGGNNWIRTGNELVGSNSVYPNKIIVDPVNSQILYVVSGYGQGLWKSSNGGGSWAPAHSGLPPSPHQPLAINTENNQILYAGTRSAGGVYKSADGGISWAEADQGLNSAWVDTLVLDPDNPDTLYAGTHRFLATGAVSYGVYRTTDGANSWEAMNEGFPSDVSSLFVTALAIGLGKAQPLFAGTSNGLWRYTLVDGGFPLSCTTSTAFDQAQVGDIIVSRGDKADVQFLAYGGYWTHIGMITSEVNGELYVVHSYPDSLRNPRPGVVREALRQSSFCVEAADTALLRVHAGDWDPETVASYALGQEGRDYNWHFDEKERQDSFYCSQLVWAAYYRNGGLDLDSDQIAGGQLNTLLRKTDVLTMLAWIRENVVAVAPDDIYHSPHVAVISQETGSAGQPLKRFVMWVFSPANLYLVAPDGRAIGTHPTTGVMVQEIPGASYNGPDEGPEVIAIPDMVGDWELHVTGVDTGLYTLLIENVDQNHHTNIVEGTTALGVEATYTISTDSNGTLVVVSQDTLPPVTFLALDGTPSVNGWFVTPVTLTLTAEDMPTPGAVGVRLTEYSLDDGTTWLQYTQSLVLGDGVYTLLYRSVDHVNNLEGTQSTTVKVDAAPPIVNAWTDQVQYTRVEPYTVHFSGSDPEPGSGLSNLIGEFNSQAVNNGQLLDLFWLDLGVYTLAATGQDHAGWTTTSSTPVELVATIESLQDTVDRLCVEDYITNTGTCQSLRAKLDAALTAQESGQTTVVLNTLNAFQNAVNAQTGRQPGKHIRPEAARLLLMDSDYLIQSIDVGGGGEIVPEGAQATATILPTSISTVNPSATATATATEAETATSTATASSTPTYTPTFTETPTLTPTATLTPTVTPTDTPTSTPTDVPTATDIPSPTPEP